MQPAGQLKQHLGERVENKRRSVDYSKLAQDQMVSAGTARSMRSNRSTDSSPERLLREALCEAGLRGYRKNWPKLPGKPDVVWVGRRVALDLRGCYWHACPACLGDRRPAKNSAYWSAKLARNIERDAVNVAKLEALGYRVIIVWEHELKDMEAVLARIKEAVDARP